MIAIVGGGISGLSAAWYLTQASHACTLIESKPRLGGVIDTASWEGCVIEGGPDSFLGIKPEAAQLGKELGLDGELISSNDDRRVTYIWKNGRLIALPDGMMMMVPTKTWPVVTTPLLGWGTKIRMGLEYFRRPGGERPERSVAEFIEEHYGKETVDYLAEPLLSGVYGGNPRALSVNAVLPRFVEMERKYGSLTRGALEARKRMPPSGALFRTFRRGLGSLVEALEQRLAGGMMVVHAVAEAIERTGEGWRVHAGGEWVEASHVVLAIPAYAAASLLRPLDGELGRLLDTVEYSSSMTVALAYRPGRLPIEPDGFGFLVPGKERRKLRALTHVQNKFPFRAPEGYAVIRCFLGGAGKEAVLEESDEAILRGVMRDLREMIGLDAGPDYQRIVRWPRAMAQYTLGHAYRVKKIEGRVKGLRGVFLAGNAYGGIGVPDCIRTGRLAAEAIVRGGQEATR
ncbi:MAG: protoporphyrinogen oxidase [Bryobacterales bacterium]|nr:protoporphyrinogen oxidase [Bryobacterales bacterium]